jgi:hypothetical protein
MSELWFEFRSLQLRENFADHSDIWKGEISFFSLKQFFSNLSKFIWILTTKKVLLIVTLRTMIKHLKISIPLFLLIINFIS